MEDFGKFVNAGIDTLDCADHYGDAEAIIGQRCYLFMTFFNIVSSPNCEGQVSSMSRCRNLMAVVGTVSTSCADCRRQVSEAGRHRKCQSADEGLYLGI